MSWHTDTLLLALEHLAAGDTPALGTKLAGFVAVVIVLYIGTCLIWPYRFCRRCQGGKRLAPIGRVFRNCPSCGGSGRHTRGGAKLIAHLTRRGRNHSRRR